MAVATLAALAFVAAACGDDDGGGAAATTTQPAASTTAGSTTTSGGGPTSSGPTTTSTAERLDPPVEIRVQTGSSGVSNLDLLVAVHGGFFEEQGLEPTLLPNVPNAGQLALSTVQGDVDFVETGNGALFAARGADRSVVAVAAGSGPTWQLTMSKATADELAASGVTAESSTAERVEALKGLTIGTTAAGGSAEQVVRSAILAYGGNPDTDVTFVALADFTALAGALKANQLDAMVGAAPTTIVPVLEGFGVLWINAPADDLKAQSDVYQQLHMTSAAFAEDHPEVVAAYVRAIAAVHDLIGNDPDAASAIYKAEVPDLDDTARDESVRSVAPAFDISPIIDQARFELTLENYNATAPEKVTVDFADAVVGG